MDWSEPTPRCGTVRELSVVRRGDGSQNADSDESRKLQGKGTNAESVRGLADWKSLMRNHREVLNISLDPPETKRILLKTKKFVNASLRWSAEMILNIFRKEASPAKNNRCKNPLALRKTCDIFAPVCIPHFSDHREFEQGLSGEGRESNSGGRAAWASFFYSSSG